MLGLTPNMLRQFLQAINHLSGLRRAASWRLLSRLDHLPACSRAHAHRHGTSGKVKSRRDAGGTTPISAISVVLLSCASVPILLRLAFTFPFSFRFLSASAACSGLVSDEVSVLIEVFRTVAVVAVVSFTAMAVHEETAQHLLPVVLYLMLVLILLILVLTFAFALSFATS